jgi:hypothetical protein
LLAGAQQCALDGLVLWDPVIDGRTYVRGLELQGQEILHNLGVRPECPDADRMPIETLGFPLPEALRLDLEGIDLLAIRRTSAGVALLLESEGLPDVDPLATRLRSLDVAVDRRHLPGPAFWLQERDSTLVPHQALQDITSWVSESCP